MNSLSRYEARVQVVKAMARYTKACKVSNPALIVVKIVDNKVASYCDVEEIWTKVTDKPALLS